MKEMVEERKKEDITFLKEHDGGSFICVKSQKSGDDGWPSKYGFLAKLGPNKFQMYEGNINKGDAVEIGIMSAEEILEQWWID